MTDAPHKAGLSLRLKKEAQRVASQHQQLDQFHSVFSDALARGDAGAARIALERFTEALDAHFSLEEEFYFPALHGHRKQLAPDLEHLARDHAVLRAALAEVTGELARENLHAGEAALNAWLARLREHERAEEKLIEAANGAV